MLRNTICRKKKGVTIRRYGMPLRCVKAGGALESKTVAGGQLAPQYPALAGDGLADFLGTRFILTEEQLEYAEDLPLETAHLWSQQLAYAIEHQLPLELFKPELSIRASTKYIRSESSTSAGTPARAAGAGDYLRFIITEYPDSP